jgi:hypothetical protein
MSCEVEGMTSRLIYVCSPLKAYRLDGRDHPLEENRDAALGYRRYVFKRGYYAIVPHFDLTARDSLGRPLLDDGIPSERQAGRAMALAILSRCDELWVFGSYISDGMLDEIDLAIALAMPIVWLPDGPDGSIRGLPDLQTLLSRARLRGA